MNHFALPPRRTEARKNVSAASRSQDLVARELETMLARAHADADLSISGLSEPESELAETPAEVLEMATDW